MGSRASYILRELRAHAPFTLFGTLLGVVFMLLFGRLLSESLSYRLFYVFHPAHVFLSAITTAAMFRLYSRRANVLLVLLIGYVGSIGIATLSDSLIPYAGEMLLGFHVDVHGHGEQHTNENHIDHSTHDHEKQPAHHTEHSPDEHRLEDGRHGSLHLGFLERWYIVNPAAVLGALLAFFWPRTELPHAGHVLLSIWASLFHVLMAAKGDVSVLQYVGISVFLFIAVWLPCCVSDIIFPLLFTKTPTELPTHH